MTGLAVLGLLLVGSYLGGFLVGGGGKRARGLASGAGMVLLGFVSGPAVLGLLSAETLELFTPLMQVGVGWLALNSGLVYGRVFGRPVRISGALAGIAVALVTAAGVTGAVQLALMYLPRLRAAGLDDRDRWVLALGVGAALSETTRSVGRWARERYRARGPFFDRLLDLAAADDLVPVLLAAVSCALLPLHPAARPLAFYFAAPAQLVAGFVLGAAAALMLGRDFRLNVARGVLIGVSLVGIGSAVELRLSLVAMLFALGLGLVVVSRHRERIRRMTTAERYVVLPVLFLAGAMTSGSGILPWVAAVAVGARLLTKLVAGFGLWVGWREARPAGPLLGAGLASSGTLSVAVGLSFALHVPGVIGASVLAASSLAVVAGELIGPPSFRSALRNAGEIPAATAETQGALPAEAPS